MAWDVFEEKTNEYDDWFDRRFGAGAFDLELRCIKRLFGKVPENSLEIGAGTGRFASSLNIKYGIDPSLRAAHYSKKRGIQVVNAVAESLPFHAFLFSSVFMIVTVCFLDDPAKAFAEANRVLEHQGTLIMGLILKDSKWGDFYEHKKDSGNVFYKNAHFWAKDELLTALGKAGFRLAGAASTLFDPPGSLMIVNQKIQDGIHHDAGFHTLAARKITE